MSPSLCSWLSFFLPYHPHTVLHTLFSNHYIPAPHYLYHTMLCWKLDYASSSAWNTSLFKPFQVAVYDSPPSNEFPVLWTVLYQCTLIDKPGVKNFENNCSPPVGQQQRPCLKIALANIKHPSQLRTWFLININTNSKIYFFLRKYKDALHVLMYMSTLKKHYNLLISYLERCWNAHDAEVFCPYPLNWTNVKRHQTCNVSGNGNKLYE